MMKNVTALLIGTTFAVGIAAFSSNAASTPTSVPTGSSSAIAMASPSPTACDTGTPQATPNQDASAEGDVTQIVISANGQTITADLNDSDVSQDLIATLPTTLSWYRNYGIEYITELSSSLTETGPFYTDVQAGDIVYYNPMDSLTIIYRPTSSVPTLTKMGEITSDLSVFENLPDIVDMQIELACR
jgi:hypothetical protein